MNQENAVPPAGAESPQDPSRTSSEEGKSRNRNIPRYSPLFLIGHWVLAVTIPLLLITGISLHAVVRREVPGPGNQLPDWALSGRVFLYHIYLAYLFAPAILSMLGATLVHPPSRQFYRRTTLAFLVFGSLILLVTGYILLHLVDGSSLYISARRLHNIFGLFLVPAAYVIHLYRALFTKRRALLGQSFLSRERGNWCASISVFAILAVLTSFSLVNTGFLVRRSRLLEAKPIPSVQEAPQFDYASLPWEEAKTLVIPLANGMGFDHGCTKVRLKALHDDRHLYVYASWDDAKEDRQYIPWEKTDDGWMRLVTDPSDESVYYEDKFSLVFPIEEDNQFERFGCSEYCHLGGGNAYGYKASDIPVDVWHWKATRTDPFGQVDDKYWSLPEMDKATKGRYGDPKTAGGYEKNQLPEADHPAYLPEEPAYMHDGVIPREHAVEYDASLAENYEVGQKIAGIVASAVEGDRGDVLCQSKYEDGRWNLYICRELDTGSAHDRVFQKGKLIPFGCAAFDSSSKRHAYELSTYWLELSE
jgi:hypothetical protein